VEERPVPKGDVPGEWYSPTQPIPVRPRPLSRVSFNKDTDLVRPEDTSPEHVAACVAMMEKAGGYFNAGPFTPFMYKADGAPPKSTIQTPGGTGGVNWGGMALDPSTSYAFVNAQNTTLVGWTGNGGSAGPSVTAGGLVFVGATNDGRFRAFDAKTGKELWVTKLPTNAAGNPSNANANPMSYQGRSGRQYVAVVAGTTLVTYALP
jgi:glucose dehydrogenase